MAWNLSLIFVALIIYGWPVWRVVTMPALSRMQRGAWIVACLVLPGLGFLIFWAVCVLPHQAHVERRTQGQNNG
jgi:hypothetical protein